MAQAMLLQFRSHEGVTAPNNDGQEEMHVGSEARPRPSCQPKLPELFFRDSPEVSNMLGGELRGGIRVLAPLHGHIPKLGAKGSCNPRSTAVNAIGRGVVVKSETCNRCDRRPHGEEAS